jgi:hypothetical protein
MQLTSNDTPSMLNTDCIQFIIISMKSLIPKAFLSLLKRTPIRYTSLFINNQFVPSTSGLTLSVIDPSTEKEICRVASATPEDGALAFEGAQRCYTQVWSKTSAE